MSRMYALDGARGLAAFCILLFHTVGTRVSAFSHLYIAVDFFFVLSGFVLAPAVARVRDIPDAQRFLISRFMRIFPMVLAIITFTAIYDLLILSKHWFMGQPSTSPIILNIPTLIMSLLMLQVLYRPAVLVDFPIWSLSAEWLVNIMVGLAQALTRKGKYLSLVFGVALIIGSVFFKSELLNQIGRALWGFSFGLIAFDCRSRSLQNRKVLIVISLFLTPVYFATPVLGGFQSIFSIWPFAACITILSQSNPNAQISEKLSIVGKYSYGFYLWHFLMLNLSSYLLAHINVDLGSALGVLLEILLTSTFSISATKVSLIFFEGPIRRYWQHKSQLL